ncbi:hypothetical protein FG386_002477 [Cryptosporidium ryanae]|uniref:uncharacterized protein n=1 Tax=Cryptosporidium ryanae TaxID=515981 RepID=UPI003519FB60|nr:hypothetical protein FG386_002477 [Cryptosporidium ryanae]
MNIKMKSLQTGNDINDLISPYLDSQMLFYLVKWLKKINVYDKKSLEVTEIAILKTTFLYNEMKELYPDQLSDFILSEEENNKIISSLSNSLSTLISALKKWKEAHDESSRSLKRKSLIELQQWFINSEEDELSSESSKIEGKNDVSVSEDANRNFPANPIQLLVRLSRLYYLSGKYKDSQYILDIILKTIPECTNIDVPLITKVECYFGSIANGIVSNLSNLQDSIEPSTYLNYFQLVDDTLTREFHKINPVQIYLYKSWLLHWSLFPLFTQYFRETSFNNKQNIPGTANNSVINNDNSLYFGGSTNVNLPMNIWGPFLDWFASERNFNVISIVCPHLLRYLACFGIIMRRNRDVLESIVNLISLHRNKVNDSFTELLFNLFVNFDFESSQRIFSTCGSAVEYDFFLHPIQKYIEENSRLLVFEIYCRIHKSIDLNLVSEDLGVTNIEAERWIVNLIRNLHLEGKLDYEHNRVEMIDKTNKQYQSIADKTRNILFRSNILTQNLSNNPSFSCNIVIAQKNKSNWRAQSTKQSVRNERKE